MGRVKKTFRSVKKTYQRILIWLRQKKYFFYFRNATVPRLRRQLLMQAGGDINTSWKGMKVLLPIMETTHYQHQHILGLGKILQLRGATVAVLVCDESLPGCEIKSVKNFEDRDPCRSCRFHRETSLPIYDFIVYKPTDWISEEERREILAQDFAYTGQKALIFKGIDVLNSAMESVTRFFYGETWCDKDEQRAQLQNHVATAKIMGTVAKNLMSTWKPDIVINNMSVYSTWEPIYEIARLLGIRFHQISLQPYDFKTVLIDSWRLYESTERFFEYQSTRTDMCLSDDESKRLDQFIKQRKGGESDLARKEGYFRSTSLEIAAKALRYDETKRNIFMFSNIHWDVGIADFESLFPSVLEWCLETVEMLRNAPGIHLYLKPHPAEFYDGAPSLKGVSQILRETIVPLPENLTIIEPTLRLNTYELFPMIDLGVIFNGTLGLEMLLHGIPVVSTGRTTYSGLGFASEPGSISEYEALLLGRHKPAGIEVSKVREYAYFYFLRTNLPWRLTEQAYGDSFDGFAFESVSDVAARGDPYLEQLCAYLLNPKTVSIDAW